MQLRVKDLPKVSTWRLEWVSNMRPSGRKAPNLPLRYHILCFMHIRQFCHMLPCLTFKCNVNLRKPLSADKSHVKETSLFTAFTVASITSIVHAKADWYYY